jgi:hypothetical protein
MARMHALEDALDAIEEGWGDQHMQPILDAARGVNPDLSPARQRVP